MRIFLVGASGYIGKSITDNIKENYQVICTHRNGNKNDHLFLDLENPEAFDFSMIRRNDVLLMLSAISSPDVCADNYQYAEKINVKGTSFLIQNALSRGCKVIFFSSDTVYGNMKGVRSEESPIAPFGEYAVMKSVIENRFIYNCNFKVLRLSYVFSKEDKFTKYIQTCIEKDVKCEVFHPFKRNVIWIEDVKLAVKNLISDWNIVDSNVVNLCGKKNLSRLKMAKEYKKRINKDLVIRKVKPTEKFFSRRSCCIKTKSIYLDKILGQKTTNFRKALVQELNKNK